MIQIIKVAEATPTNFWERFFTWIQAAKEATTLSVNGGVDALIVHFWRARYLGRPQHARSAKG
ncbi:MAG: hypothetical protein NVSMB1_11680 [Polyangiales bacterium]